MPHPQIDLSWLYGGMQGNSPRVNPDFDPSDPNSTPYLKPSFWQNVLQPGVAGEQGTLNAQYQLAPQLAQQQYNIQRGLVGQDVATIPDQYQPFGDNTEANKTAAKYAGLSPQALLTGRTDIASMNLGGAEQAALARYNTDTATAQTQANEAQKQVLRGLLGTPANEAYTESLGDKYQAGEYGGNLALQPYKFHDQSLALGNDISQQEGLQTRMPLLMEQASNEAATKALLSGTQLDVEPFTARQMQNEAIGGAFSSGYAPVMPPVGNRVNSDGTITPLTRNPGGMYAPMMGLAAMQDGGMNPMGGGTSVITVNGKKVVVASPKQDISPLGSRISPLKARTADMDEEESLKARLEQLRAARASIVPLPSSRGHVISQGISNTGHALFTPLRSVIDWFNQPPQG